MSNQILHFVFISIWLIELIKEGETVEFTKQNDASGRLKASLVTGPMGAFVQGAPKESFSRSFEGGAGFNSAPRSFKKRDDLDDEFDDFSWAPEPMKYHPEEDPKPEDGKY